jgi:hypothetical protein
LGLVDRHKQRTCLRFCARTLTRTCSAVVIAS